MKITTRLTATRKHIARVIPNTFRWAGKLAIASIALPGALTLAQAADSAPDPRTMEGGIVGLGVAYVPRYQGSDQHELKALPILAYRWSNGVFVGGENNTVLGYQFSGADKTQYGVALGVDTGRKESLAGALAGMGDVEIRPTFVSFVKGAITDELSFNANAHLGSGNDKKGALLKVGAAYAIPLAPSALLSLTVAATLANASYMENYVGVSAAQAVSSHYRAYAPSGGLNDITIGMRLSYRVNADWTALAGVSNTSLSNAAKDSPLVRRPNTQNVFFGMAYSIR